MPQNSDSSQEHKNENKIYGTNPTKKSQEFTTS